MTEQKIKAKECTFCLPYRPPYRYEAMLRFLAARTIAGVEAIVDETYMRSVKLPCTEKGSVNGWIRVGHLPEEKALYLTLSGELSSLAPQISTKVRRAFDLDCDPEKIFEALLSMNRIRPYLSVSGTRLPGCFNAFEMSVRAVLGQQITVKAAHTIAGRLVQAYGRPVHEEIPGLTHTFPLPEDILALKGPVEDHLGPLGIISRRARTIFELARTFHENSIECGASVDPEEVIEKLLAIPGIGKWTAHYIAMRAFGWRDAFLETDAGIKKALAPRSTKEILQLAEAWRPWRSYACINLWNSL
ncbi:MAG: 3-methyladenine DNA glycosylase 2 [Candidatus Hydrogenedens sp.]|jgi:AraC family transcriptional regulator of adaptative response / DNA-3-methyladenine glycosylase II|nr:3-methyladenine DNA glycosylase 2 [Candidatus Hydrogenedens sp.]